MHGGIQSTQGCLGAGASRRVRCRPPAMGAVDTAPCCPAWFSSCDSTAGNQAVSAARGSKNYRAVTGDRALSARQLICLQKKHRSTRSKPPTMPPAGAAASWRHPTLPPPPLLAQERRCRRRFGSSWHSWRWMARLGWTTTAWRSAWLPLPPWQVCGPAGAAVSRGCRPDQPRGVTWCGGAGSRRGEKVAKCLCLQGNNIPTPEMCSALCCAGSVAFLLHTGHVAGWRQYASLAELPPRLLAPQAARLPVVMHSAAQHGEVLAVRVAHYPLLRRLVDGYRRCAGWEAVREAGWLGGRLAGWLAGWLAEMHLMPNACCALSVHTPALTFALKSCSLILPATMQGTVVCGGAPSGRPQPAAHLLPRGPGAAHGRRYSRGLGPGVPWASENNFPLHRTRALAGVPRACRRPLGALP